jgi:hypothetical protein
MIRVFISYCDADRPKKDVLRKRLHRSPGGFEPVVVADRRTPGKPLADKVLEGIAEARFFVPILTRDAVTNQWVNQEIGCARALNRVTIPLVEAAIVGTLKGFIHDQNDLPFTFGSRDVPAQHQGRAFGRACGLLVTHLEDSHSTLFESSLEPTRVKRGHSYTTTVRFRGTVRNGFFDNRVQHLESKFRTWNVDPETFKTTPATHSSVTPGLLNGAVDVVHSYTHSTRDWPTGIYQILVRLYSHVVPGARGRQVVAENEHPFEVY